MRILQTFPEPAQIEGGTDAHKPSSALEEFLNSSYSPPAGPFVRANIVLSANGSLVDEDGRSGGISSAFDRKILRLIRSFSDVVIEGAGTLRAEGLIFPKGETKLAVLTASGVLDLPDDERIQNQLLIFCAANQIAQLQEYLPEHPPEWFTVPRNLTQAVREVDETLIARGHRQLVCEGGAQILDAFLAAGLIDELAVTHSPKRSTRMVRLAHWPNRDFQLTQEFSDDEGFVFQRWTAIPETPRP